MTKYRAEIKPLNADKIGTRAHGTAEFELTATTLKIVVEMFDTPASMQHWEHFHGFPDGREAEVPTMVQDVNGDGFIDLEETFPVSGTTMVPFDDQPDAMNIPNDTYPVSDQAGHYKYEKEVPLANLQAQFEKTFKTSDLALDKRVVYVHGVSPEMPMPASVGGNLNEKYTCHTTLPIACGKIVKVD
ncbi:hypothetical protein [Lactobacillus corticis]|uniref:Uncharacterized protein n=1 Tax=Lactobacillus corticis TaxID=2201249 RepID=A0A916QKV2_9LACO|nr:hypothetical protein [Lactobacillus corticis]GFZ27505.1 hypothetical protein LCB40_13850 [Lactobacillus corticis]